MGNKKPMRIYVVDDKRIVADTLTMILQRSGFSTRSFFSPLEALSAVQSDAPDLLISDVTMPELSGMELAIQMKELCPKCNVLLLSGKVDTADVLYDSRQQGYDFKLLANPLHPSVFLQSVRLKEQRLAQEYDGGQGLLDAGRLTHA